MGVQTRRVLTSSDAWYASGEVADDRKGPVFADEGKIDIVVCEVGGEVFYAACACGEYGKSIARLWVVSVKKRSQMARRLGDGGWLPGHM